jgi:VIT1/CCC1 family predicted Fe2+/Mn2+ transporter
VIDARRGGGHNAGMADDVAKEEIRSAIEARRELGEDMEPAVVEAFVARIEQRIAERAQQSRWALESKRNHQKEMVLGSMGIAVPMLVAAAIFTGLPGVIAVCVALVAIAVVSTRS